jgi:hypothetical protein
MKAFSELNAEQVKKWDAIPHYPLGEVPEELIDKNPKLYRTIIAKRAILAGYEDFDHGTVADILFDLRHLCDALDVDFADLDRVAYRNYIEESARIALEERAVKPKLYVILSGGLINSVYATKGIGDASIVILDRDEEDEDNDGEESSYAEDSAEFDRALKALELINLV